ncbi:MAG: hypothetical protein JEZ09_00970 [Salinivirgaceae bacterium]|nr:hypothetical protein [Salinivirgaceae bacterium]
MQQKNYISKKSLTFSKWSRKGYAVFASLGKVVKIGQLNVEICKQAIKKNTNLLIEFVLLEKDKLNQKTDESIEFLLSEYLFQNVISIKAIDSKLNPQENKKIKVYNQNPFRTFGMDFLI